MRNLQILLLVITLVGIAYCIRLLRALHQRLSKIASHNAALSKESKTLHWQSYRQSEALVQLFALLKFTAPIPPTRSWAASPDLLLTLVELVRTYKPRLVVELGSGLSTLILAKSGAKKIISVDHSEEFADQTRAMLKAHSIRGVQVRVAALKPHVSGVDWYDTTQLSDLKKIDLLIIDGPPGSKNTDSRKPARPELIHRLSPRAVIVIDDVNRQGERELAEAFAKALPTHVLTIFPHEKGTAVISPK